MLLELECAKVLSRLARVASAETVIHQIREVPKDRWRELVAHVDFSGDQPDPLIETLVIESENGVVRARAAAAFIHPTSGWVDRT